MRRLLCVMLRHLRLVLKLRMLRRMFRGIETRSHGSHCRVSDRQARRDLLRGVVVAAPTVEVERSGGVIGVHADELVLTRRRRRHRGRRVRSRARRKRVLSFGGRGMILASAKVGEWHAKLEEVGEVIVGAGHKRVILELIRPGRQRWLWIHFCFFLRSVVFVLCSGSGIGKRSDMMMRSEEKRRREQGKGEGRQYR